MKKLIPIALFTFLQSLTAWASAHEAHEAHEAHVHGVATLSLAQDGSKLFLEFDSPLDNLLGFEHAPRTDKQKQTARDLLDLMHKPATLIKLTAEADCQLSTVKLLAPILQATEKASTNKDEHANLHAEYEYTCARVAALKSLQLSLFDAFPAIRQVEAQMAGPRGQAAATLTTKQRLLTW
ncbi:DUF2796 domain-containing protein [Undibacterium sp. CY18W]|uniref:DUF2796 domain-containing protein n=1 Tax=Undibacterium hunanense TaxID=2762292 RepID=A0ABR6ZU25_9BURK|nr:DUF2796 domain-containing protein [Undibacterium hunanense]MBC3919314.1 DUF2796 domain-containing protein [Undibacterium hunanense]